MLSGALRVSDHAIRALPHGHLHDQYQRNDILCPGLLSFAAGVISPRGGFRVEVRETLAEFDELADCARYWVARTEWRDINAPYLIVRDPVVWADIPWLIRECELAILAWLRAQNDPDAWEIPGLKEWFRRRNKYHIGRIGRDEYAKQYREFWNRDLAIGVIS